jgi:hypothetical protein
MPLLTFPLTCYCPESVWAFAAEALTQPGRRLGSLIDAGLYEGQPEDLTASWPNPAIYLDPAYWKELQRRNALQGNGVNLDSYRQEQPARFPLLKLPPSQECGQAAQAS